MPLDRLARTRESYLDKAPQAADTQEIPTPKPSYAFNRLSLDDQAIAKFLIWDYQVDENDNEHVLAILNVLKEYHDADSF